MATIEYKNSVIAITAVEEVFPEFELGTCWMFTIDGISRPSWATHVSEDDAIEQAKAIVDQWSPKLYDYHTGDVVREATAAEVRESVEAAKYDGGAGVISVDGRSCYAM